MERVKRGNARCATQGVKPAHLKLKKLERRVFPEGNDPKKRAYDNLRWSRFKHFEAKEMFEVVNDHVFPFLRTLGGDDSTYAHHMKDARFTIPTPALLAKVVDMIDGVPMEDRDTKADLYEYMPRKIASAGQNGQFRTPRHIIQLMVELTAPTAKDVICDPACGTGGFPRQDSRVQPSHQNRAQSREKLIKRVKAGTHMSTPPTARIRPASDGGGGAEEGGARAAGGAGRALRHPPAPRLQRRAVRALTF